MFTLKSNHIALGFDRPAGTDIYLSISRHLDLCDLETPATQRVPTFDLIVQARKRFAGVRVHDRRTALAVLEGVTRG